MCRWSLDYYKWFSHPWPCMSCLGGCTALFLVTPCCKSPNVTLECVGQREGCWKWWQQTQGCAVETLIDSMGSALHIIKASTVSAHLAARHRRAWYLCGAAVTAESWASKLKRFTSQFHTSILRNAFCWDPTKPRDLKMANHLRPLIYLFNFFTPGTSQWEQFL